jgi:hypothetical protein
MEPNSTLHTDINTLFIAIMSQEEHSASLILTNRGKELRKHRIKKQRKRTRMRHRNGRLLERSRLQECLRKGGGHFEDSMFKK